MTTQPAPVVLWRRVIRSAVRWMDGTHRWVEHPRTGKQDMEQFHAYPAALDPASKVAALTEERDTALARIKAMEERDGTLRRTLGRLLGYLASLDLGEKVNNEVLAITEPAVMPGDAALAEREAT